MRGPWRSFGIGVAVCAVAGVVLRVAYVLATPDMAGLGDWQFYQLNANSLADGDGFVDFARSPSALHPPLYPFVLAIPSLFGATSEVAHRLVGAALLGPTTIVLVGLLGRRVGGARVGVAAAAVIAFWPLMLAADGALMSETLYGPLIAGTLLASYRVLDGGGRRWVLGLGALIGLAALTRSEALTLVPLLAWPVVFKAGGGLGGDRARWLRDGALVAAACALVIAPWAIRNASEFGTFTPISTNDGTVLAGANCDQTYASGEFLGGWRLDCAPRDRSLNEGEQGGAWRSQAFSYAADHADRLPVVAVVRVLRTWNLWPATFTHAAEGVKQEVNLAGIYTFLLVLPFGIAGLVLLWRRREPVWILAAPAVAATLASIYGWGVPRLRFGADIALAVLAAVALVALVELVVRRVRARQEPRSPAAV